MLKKWMTIGIIVEMIFILVIGYIQQKEGPDNVAVITDEVTAMPIETTNATNMPAETAAPEFIKWVDFDATYEALCTAYQIDVDTYGGKKHINWIDLLAYAAVRTGGNFKGNTIRLMNDVKAQICEGKTTMEKLTEKLKSYEYYHEVYDSVLSQYVGEYEIQEKDEVGGVKYIKKYGLKVFSPIAKGFSFSDYDDFGVSRGYGYQRKHLGHDMMGLIGTPIIAVEGGTIEAMGWNQYGGWRIGIRSHDKKRYYYYAHLRQNRPFSEGLKEGAVVKSGDVIGYMGHTGYSAKENVNNIDRVHLHLGIQLIFDESQKEGNGEIWIDCFSLTKFLNKNRCEVVKNEETKEWKRVYEIK